MQQIENVSRPFRPGAFRVWCLAARPHTLSIALVPVVVGTALAWSQGVPIHWVVALAALLAATLIQIGTNLQNDVGDYERGADAVARLGPTRVTTQGWLTPGDVRRGVTVSFAFAFALGGYLVWYGGWPIFAVGLSSVLAGLAYTSGERPIAYTGWGEAFVLAFFGIVATCGSYYLQADTVSQSALVASLAVGSIAAAVLVVNNYRDLESDRQVGKHTLVVCLGRTFARYEYAALMLAPFALLALLASMTHAGPRLALPLALLPWAVLLIRAFWTWTPGPAFNQLLARTAQFQLAFGALVAAGLAL